MGIDLEIFSTLSKASGPVTLQELAAVKNASPLITGAFIQALSIPRLV